MAAMTAASMSLTLPKTTTAIGIRSGSNAKSSQIPSVAFSKLSLQSSSFGISSIPKQSPFVVRASEVFSAESDTSSAVPSTRLFVGNLPFTVDSKSLADVFQEVGLVDLVEVIYDRETGRSRGFAFVTMNSIEDAERAINQLDGADIAGRSMRVSFPVAKTNREDRPRREGFERRSGGMSRNSPNKLYIGNLSWGMDDESLYELFSEFGKVLEAKVVIDRDTGRSRGFGFVTLSNGDEVKRAVEGLDGVEVDGRTIRVSVANTKDSSPGRY